MPLSTKQRVTVITLLNTGCLGILLVVIPSHGNTATTMVMMNNSKVKSIPPEEGITAENVAAKTPKNVSTDHTALHSNNGNGSSEKTPKIRDSVRAKHNDGKRIVQENDIEKRVTANSTSVSLITKTNASDDVTDKNRKGLTINFTPELRRATIQNDKNKMDVIQHSPKNQLITASRKLLWVPGRSNTKVTTEASESHEGFLQEYNTLQEVSPLRRGKETIDPFLPVDRKTSQVSLPREGEIPEAILSGDGTNADQEITESSLDEAKTDSYENSTAFISGDLEALQVHPSRDETKTNQQITERLYTEDEEVTETFILERDQVVKIPSILRDQKENTASFPAHDADTESSFPAEDEKNTEVSFPQDQETTKDTFHRGHQDANDVSITGHFKANNVFLSREDPEVTEASLQRDSKTAEVSNLMRDQQGSEGSRLKDSKVTTTSIHGEGQEANEISLPAADGQDHIMLVITVNMTGVTLAVDGSQMYSALNNTLSWGTGPVRLHAGLHLITLHQVTGQVMAADSYMTWQTTIDTLFLEALKETQDGRLLVILGAPDFTTFLEEATITALVELGGLYIDRLAYKDVWCLVVHKGGGVVLEALTTSLPGHNTTKHDVSPLTVQVAVPIKEARRCGWYEAAGMEEQATFCETYDGYGNFCSCHDPPWSPLPHNPVEYRVEEVIPVAIVTAHRLPHVLRQVGQLWSSPGGTITPITIFVDGHNPEARALAALLHLPLLEHHNPAPLGSTRRINSHVKFVLLQVFKRYPGIDKAIILEDDLDLAPDFIPFFQQTALLLTSDPKLACVNAYNTNAFAHTAFDPSRLYRVHGVPACGWMVRRDVAREMTLKWIPPKLNIDWDWWLRYNMMGDRDILVPELPRTKHRGGGGIHVTGLEQAYYHDQRPLNTHLNVTMDVQGAELLNYLKFHNNNIQKGQVVHFISHPCKELPIPRQQVNQSYVVYVNQPDESTNSSWAYYVVARCLGLDDHIFNENFHMMYTTSYNGNQLYVIGCPNSSFCVTKNPEDIYSVSQKDVQYANHHPFRKVRNSFNLAIRVSPVSLWDEVNLTNLMNFNIGGKWENSSALAED